MMDDAAFPPPPPRADSASDAQAYAAERERAAADPDAFFAEAARRLDWMNVFTEVSDVSFDADDLHIRWLGDGHVSGKRARPFMSG